ARPRDANSVTSSSTRATRADPRRGVVSPRAPALTRELGARLPRVAAPAVRGWQSRIAARAVRVVGGRALDLDRFVWVAGEPRGPPHRDALGGLAVGTEQPARGSVPA